MNTLIAEIDVVEIRHDSAKSFAEQIGRAELNLLKQKIVHAKERGEAVWLTVV